MTLSTLINKSEYTANGVSTEFTLECRADEASHVKVYVNSELKETGDATYGYSISGLGSNQITVTFNSAPTAGDYISLLRVIPLGQDTEYPTYDRFPSAAHEQALDNLHMLVQQIEEEVGRAIQSPIGADPGTDFTMPLYSAGKGIMWDVSTQQLTVSDDDINGLLTACQTSQSACNTAVADCGLALNSCNIALGLTQAARDAAIVAQLAAETAQTAAETAETNVEAFPTDGHQWSKQQHNAASAVTNQSSATIDFDGTPEINMSLNQAITLTFSNIGTGDANWGKSIFFRITNSSGGPHAITWPASVKWMDGADSDGPASGEDKLICIYAVSSSTQYGMIVWEG